MRTPSVRSRMRRPEEMLPEENLPESGVDQNLKAKLASSAAGELSQEELGITEANYATGRENFNRAVSGEQALAGEYNPVATGNLATGANTARKAFSEANQIQQQQNQEEADIARRSRAASQLAR